MQQIRDTMALNEAAAHGDTSSAWYEGNGSVVSNPWPGGARATQGPRASRGAHDGLGGIAPCALELSATRHQDQRTAPDCGLDGGGGGGHVPPLGREPESRSDLGGGGGGLAAVSGPAGGEEDIPTLGQAWKSSAGRGGQAPGARNPCNPRRPLTPRTAPLMCLTWVWPVNPASRPTPNTTRTTATRRRSARRPRDGKAGIRRSKGPQVLCGEAW